MTMGIVGMILVWLLLDWIISRDDSTIYVPFGFMCVPFMQFIYSSSGNLLVMDDYFYIAPYSRKQRKALFEKYFRRQFLSGCALATAWYFCTYLYTAAAGASIHPAKIIFAMTVQCCVYYQMLFLGYYRPRLLTTIVALTTFLIGGGILTGMMEDPAMTLADYIMMAVLGVICAAAALVLRLKYYEQMIDCHSCYESSRKADRGFSK
ncbi:MAG: hypothetical protein NC434_01300 [Ruminococcus sp.]|nr:hypothetical protein [Ruminococcus sp.]